MLYKKQASFEISLQQEEQIFHGWGTSLCWWSNILGRWKNEPAVDKVCQLLFDSAEGLGINVVRYNLGAGETPPNGENFRIGADIPCYLPKQGNWHWNNDAAQQRILKKAIQNGVKYIELFLNSPPLWMTVSGSTAGAQDGLCNLKESMTQELADYLAECAGHLQAEYGVPICSIAPFNEPISFWWKSTNDQEGCHFDVQQQSALIEALAQALQEKGLHEVGISAPECWSTFETIYCCNHYSEKAMQCVTQINTHSYFSNTQSRKELDALAKRLKKPLWMSEVTCGGTQSHCHNDMSSALELAHNITVHLNEMRAQAWVYWQVVENELMQHNHGLIHANFEGTEEYFLTKQYYAFGNYTKFIRPNYIMVHCTVPCDELDVVAAKSADGKHLVVVVANTSETTKTVRLSLPTCYNFSHMQVYRTSQTENLFPISTKQTDEYSAEAQSITTFSLKQLE